MRSNTLLLCFPSAFFPSLLAAAVVFSMLQLLSHFFPLLSHKPLPLYQRGRERATAAAVAVADLSAVSIAAL